MKSAVWVVLSEVAGLPGVVVPYAESALREGGTAERDSVDGIDLVLVRRKKDECEEVFATAYLRRETGAAWNLAAVVCDPRALNRMRALVRAVATPELALTIPHSSHPSDEQIGEADRGKLRPGMPWSEISQLGVSFDVSPAPDGGLVITYFDGRPDRLHRAEKVRLFLSRTRSLVRWEPEDLSRPSRPSRATP